MNLKRVSVVLGICLVIIAVILASTVKVSAMDIKGLTISPIRTEIDIAPGTSKGGTLLITNSDIKSIDVKLSAEQFSVINPQYDYAFVNDSTIAKWVTFGLSEFELKPNETKQINFIVGVPINAEPGGRYISLFASTNTGSAGENINSLQRVASLLYITVAGDVTRNGNLISLTSPWIVGGESQWSVVLQNTGTTHFRSQYNVQIQNLWGGAVANMSGDALILPGTVRSVVDRLPLPQIPGIYKIVYNIELGDEPAKNEISWMIYMPLWAIIILAIFVMLIIWLLFRKIKKH